MISPKNLILISMLLLLSAPLYSLPARAQTVVPSTSTRSAPCGTIGDECPLSVSPPFVQGAPGDVKTVNIVVNNTMWLNNWRVEVSYDFSMLSAVRVCALNSSNIWHCPGSPSVPPPIPAPWTNGGCVTGNSYLSDGTLVDASMPTTCSPLTTFDANGIDTPAPSLNGVGCSVAASHFDRCIVEGQTLLGGLINATGTTGLTLFSIDFTVMQAGTSEITLTSTHATSLQLLSGGFPSGPFAGSIAPECTTKSPCAPSICPGMTNCPGGPDIFFAFPFDGTVAGIGSASFVKSGVSPAFHHLSISKTGGVQTLQALVVNTGTVNVYVRVEYTIVSEAGDVTFVGTGVLLLPPPSPSAAFGTLSVSYNVPTLPIRYHVVGILMVSADGHHFVLAGSTDTTQYSVVP